MTEICQGFRSFLLVRLWESPTSLQAATSRTISKLHSTATSTIAGVSRDVLRSSTPLLYRLPLSIPQRRFVDKVRVFAYWVGKVNRVIDYNNIIYREVCFFFHSFIITDISNCHPQQEPPNSSTSATTTTAKDTSRTILLDIKKHC